jgi:hypothetical protein
LMKSGELPQDANDDISAASLAALLRKPEAKGLFTGSTAVFRKVR